MILTPEGGVNLAQVFRLLNKVRSFFRVLLCVFSSVVAVFHPRSPLLWFVPGRERIPPLRRGDSTFSACISVSWCWRGKRRNGEREGRTKCEIQGRLESTILFFVFDGVRGKMSHNS